MAFFPFSELVMLLMRDARSHTDRRHRARPIEDFLPVPARQPFGADWIIRAARAAGVLCTDPLRAGRNHAVSKGDPGTELFAVSAGTVKISVPAPDGREAMFNLLHPGEIFGEIALLDGRPRTADAMAITDCELTVIERRDFLAFVQSEPNVALQLIALLCERLRIASEHYEELVFLDLPTRLARILLQLADQNEAGAEEPKLKITQREISQMLGLTRESVNKQLRAWAKRGLIALERGGIVVYRLAALAAIAGGVGKRDT